MNLTFRLEGERELSRALRDFADETGRELGKVVQEAASQVAIELNQRTPPQTLGQGLGALTGDTHAVFHDLNRTYRELRQINQDQAAGFWRIAQRKPSQIDQYLDTTPLAALNTGVPDDATHNAARTVRGRVPRQAGSGKIVVRHKSKLATYLKRRSKAVGAAKASWAHAAQAINGRSVRGPERWANTGAHKHVSGTAQLSGMNDGKNPTVTLISHIPYIAALVSAATVDAALRSAAVRLRERGRLILEKRAARV